VCGEQRGPGTYCYINGDVFKGSWVYGKKHGEGLFSKPKSHATYR
jgi:hypothetical protein